MISIMGTYITNIATKVAFPKGVRRNLQQPKFANFWNLPKYLYLSSPEGKALQSLQPSRRKNTFTNKESNDMNQIREGFYLDCNSIQLPIKNTKRSASSMLETALLGFAHALITAAVVIENFRKFHFMPFYIRWKLWNWPSGN